VTSKPILVETRERILYVTLNRPEKRNALSRSLLGEIRSAFETHAADQTLAAAVLRAAGDKSFAAGGDLGDLDGLRSEQDGRDMALLARGALDSVRRFPVPVIAALNGDALGGGAELSVSCDFRVASPLARIGFIQGRLAISTAWGGGIDLFELLGRRPALRLLCTGDILDAQRAHAIGLIDALADAPGSLDAAVETFVAPMRAISPQAQRGFKALSRATRDRTRAEQVELDWFAASWAHADHWAAHDRFMNRKRD